MKKKFLLLAMIAILSLSFVTVLSACNKQEETGPVKLEAPKGFDYDGTYITWAPVKGAAEYNVVINDGDPVAATSFTVKFKAPDDQFTVSVTAKAPEGSEEYLDSDTVTKIFNKIDAVGNIEFTADAIMTWDPVPGATAYKVQYNKNEEKNVTGCVFDEFPAGTYSVIVKAIRESEPDHVYYTLDAKTTNITVLESVINDRIKYDGEKITWNAVASAVNYRVWIDESDKGVTTNNEYIYNANAKSFNVKVRALGNPDQKIFNAQEKGECDFTYLAPATGFEMNEGILSWNRVDGADGYEIKIKDVGTQTVESERFAGLIPGKRTTLQVRAYSNKNTYFAGWTDDLTYLVLEAPILQWAERELNGNYAEPVFWDQVSNAKGYYGIIENPDGSKSTKDLGNEVTFGSAFLTAGTYTIKVKSIAGTNSNNCDSAWSEPITVVRLAAPQLDAGAPIESDPNDVTKGFKVTFNFVPNATDYRLYKNGVESKLSGGKLQITDYMNETSTAGDEATFYLQSVGGANGNKIILDSLYDINSAFKISVLATPSVAIEPISGTVYNFGKVQGTSNYTVNVNGVYNTIDEGDNGYDLSGLTGGRTYSVSVNARGDGATTLSSKYSAAIDVKRLVAPTNVKINTESGGAGDLTFDHVDDANGYKYTIDGTEHSIEKDKTDNIASKIKQNTTLYMIAVGGYYKDNTYYMDSPHSETYPFTKLDTPQISSNNALKGTKLIWNKISSFGFSPSYRILNSRGNVVADYIDDGSYDLNEKLEGGKTETYYICAIGDGTRYINSDAPAAGLTITRLEMPNVQIDLDEKAYVWDSITQAKEYQVYIDGEFKQKINQAANTDKYYYVPGFTTVKNYYDIKITAIGNNAAGLMDSPTNQIKQKVLKLPTPNFTYGYDNDYFTNDGNITINADPVEGALGYAYIVKGTEERQMLHYHGSNVDDDFEPEDVVNYKFNPKSTGVYTVDIKALGGNFIYKNGEYYATITSEDSGNQENKITLLAYPNGLQYLEDEGLLKWNVVTGAINYQIEITFKGEILPPDKAFITPDQKFEVKKYLTSKGISYNTGDTIKFRLRALNANDNVINSEWTSYFERSI